jgi:tRNA(adenine34) deaminase
MRFSVDPDRFSGAHQYTVVTSMIKPQSQLLGRIVRGIAVDERLMETALEEAKTAAMEGEVPVGAVLSRGGEIIARDHNRCIQLNDPTAHAEILVIRRGGETIGNYRLGETTLYVTVEPCAMCVGAITQARVERLVYGAPDEKTGAVSSKFRLLNDPDLNHRVDVKGGVLKLACSQILRDFFKGRR